MPTVSQTMIVTKLSSSPFGRSAESIDLVEVLDDDHCYGDQSSAETSLTSNSSTSSSWTSMPSAGISGSKFIEMIEYNNARPSEENWTQQSFDEEQEEEVEDEQWRRTSSDSRSQSAELETSLSVEKPLRRPSTRPSPILVGANVFRFIRQLRTSLIKTNSTRPGAARMASAPGFLGPTTQRTKFRRSNLRSPSPPTHTLPDLLNDQSKTTYDEDRRLKVQSPTRIRKLSMTLRKLWYRLRPPSLFFYPSRCSSLIDKLKFKTFCLSFFFRNETPSSNHSFSCSSPPSPPPPN